MSTAEAKSYWNKQTSSGSRHNEAQFFRRKAEEHSSLMSPEERSAGCIDLGCGAGELLLPFSDHVKVIAGIDYSESMLSKAREVLAGKQLDLLNVDVFTYLPTSSVPVWTTTGALNQYLSPRDLEAFLDLFQSNRHSRSLCLFDCVDPIRYLMLHHGISYLPHKTESASDTKGVLRVARRFALRLRVATLFALGALGRPYRKLGSVGMGYGYRPQFWHKAAAELGLDIEIVGSRFYEYRYHVILRKKPR